MARIDHDKDRETLSKDRFDKTPPVEKIAADETGVITGVDPGEKPITAQNVLPPDETPAGGDPAQPGDGHDAGS